MELNNDIEFVLNLLRNPHQLQDTGVQQWLAQEAHRQLYEELRIYVEAGLTQSGIQVPEPDVQFNLFRRRMMRRRRLRILQLSSYAASAVIVLCFCTWFAMKPAVMPVVFVENQVPVENITPGRNQAILTTGEGEQVVLSGSSLKNRGVGSGVNIDYDSLQGVTYKLSATAELSYHTLRTPRGGEYRLVLSDGTIVWLNAESELRYPTDFRGNKREVVLIGEAYFCVSPDKQKPFIVETRGVRTRVYGTEFNVKSYSGTSVDVTLVKGSVAVEKAGIAHEYRLQPGDNAHFAGSEPEIAKVNLQKYVAWKEGYFYYENERLETIVDELKRWYDFEVIYVGDQVKSLRFELWSDRNSDISVVANLLMQTNKVGVYVEGKKVTILESKR